MKSIILALIAAATLNASCKELGPADHQRLAQYIKKKFKLAENSDVKLKGATIVEGGCFRKLEFQASGRTLAPLFLSPDLRFLTADLMDSNVDPFLLEKRKRKELALRLATGSRPSAGPTAAPVTMVIFSDFQCPYCSKMAKVLRNEVLPSESKTTRLIFRYFPLDGHDWARPAAEAAACAQLQADGYFWKLHDFLFDHQGEIRRDTAVRTIREEVRQFHGFDVRRFDICIESHATARQVEADIALGALAGVSGTPTLLINGHRATVNPAAEQIRTAIREAGDPR